MSRLWTPRVNSNGIEYGGSASQYYWEYSNNPYLSYFQWYPYYGDPSAFYAETYVLAMPNCTTYAYGRILEAGDPAPTDFLPHNANAWHNCLANGWTYEPYSPHTVREGDILEWTTNNHVAVVEYFDPNAGIIYVSQSLYTGDYGGVYDPRTYNYWGSTKQSVSNYGRNTYPDRFFTCVSMYHFGLGDPQYMLRNPNSIPDPVHPFSLLKIISKNKHKGKRRIIYV